MGQARSLGAAAGAFREAKPQPQPPISGGRDFAAKFGSKELTELVERALDDNLDLAAAIARITQADAQARVSSAALCPTVSMTDIARDDARSRHDDQRRLLKHRL